MSSCRRLFTMCQHLRHSSSTGLWTRSTEGFDQAFLHQQAGTYPQIFAKPRVALYDEQIQVSLKGFQQLERITIHGEFCHEKQRVIFASCGQYKTDSLGDLNVWEQPSEGGTYAGVEPMGLVWSLKPAPGQPEHTRMTLNVVDKPFVITIKVYNGHLNLDQIYDTDSHHPSLAEIQLERWFRFPDKVTRTEIKCGNIRGALFLPKGDGPFQGVIDLFGSAGGMIEYRAALLASHGFATLSLPFFSYKDLTKHLGDVNYDYFEEALEWFASHPKVYKNGIGTVGVSKGAEYALCMSAFSKWIKAGVIINGPTYFGLYDFYHKEKLLLKGSHFQMSEVVFTEDGAADISRCVPTKTEIIPAWRNDTKLLFVVAGDDYQYDNSCYQMYLDACPEEKKGNVEVIKYPGAGHLLEPPYTALCRATVNRSFGMLMLFGGHPKEHAHAQEDAWQRTLAHLHQYIPTS